MAVGDYPPQLGGILQSDNNGNLQWYKNAMDPYQSGPPHRTAGEVVQRALQGERSYFDTLNEGVQVAQVLYTEAASLDDWGQWLAFMHLLLKCCQRTATPEEESKFEAQVALTMLKGREK